MKCVHCGEENATTSRFCGNCGQPMTVKCSSCGETVPPGNKFCPACGARVVSAAPAMPAPTPPTMAPPAYSPPPPPPQNMGYSAPTPAWPTSAPSSPPPAAMPAYGLPPAGPSYASPISYTPSTPPPAGNYSTVSMAPVSGAAGSQWAPSAGPGPAAPWLGAQPAWVYKGLGPRFIALLIDGIIVGIPSYLLMAALFSRQMSRVAYGDTGALTGPYLLMMILSLGYSILLDAGGGTLGKRILGMKVIDEQGNKPGLSKSLVRNLLRIVDALPGFYLVGIIAVASSNTKQRVGDKAAHTFVVAK